jgi:elongator complex protein 3
MDFFTEIISQIKQGKAKDKNQLQVLKARLAKKHSLPRIPTDADILAKTGKDKEMFLKILQKKPSRTLSGVSVVAVMTKPSKCPHGRCVYCPGGYEIHTPQSYTGHEPAAMRGIQHSFDAFAQTKDRIEQLELIGHPSDKIELIVMGGTFTAQPLSYQKSFIKGCFDAMNGAKSKSLSGAQKKNESAEHRCIGLTVETRPDYCKKKEINAMLGYGVTRVELGVQHPDDAIYNIVKRGHTVKDVAEATRLCKDSLLKVNYHLMPGLPGSSRAKDLSMFREVFEDKRFKPDMIKIYPCLLVKEKYGRLPLHDMYEKGEWKPYTDDEAAELIASAKQHFPKWVRVMRIQRDIPTHLIQEGVKSSNLRQLVYYKTQSLGVSCQCIRCREIRARKPGHLELMAEQYEASGGEEYFISLEDPAQNALVGFVRMRFPFKPFRKEITKKSAGIRELHVYGPLVKIGEREGGKQQHRGYGKLLLETAEKIARQAGKKKILVMSGVGARQYYKNLGYKKDGPYVSKQLK